VRHHVEKRRAGGVVDSASLGAEETVGGIGVPATLAKGGGGCSCSGKKKVKEVLVFTLSHRGNGSQLRRCWNLG
jgi:hypothetical protein